jgi:hypothetical protein
MECSFLLLEKEFVGLIMEMSQEHALYHDTIRLYQIIVARPFMNYFVEEQVIIVILERVLYRELL